MVDLSKFKARIAAASRNAVIEYDDARAAFLDELRSVGFDAPSHLTIGKLVRIDAPDDKRGQKTGWYVFNEFETDNSKIIGVGTYGSWRGNPEKVTWSSRTMNGMNAAEKANYNAQVAAAKEHRDAEQRIIQAEAAERAHEIWNTSAVADDGDDLHHANAYLERKQVKAFDGVRQGRGNLIVPVCYEDQIVSLQFIQPDGTKTFLTGGRLKGACFTIGEPTDVVHIAEGYSTGASVHMATGNMVYVAFNAGNLYEVAAQVKAQHPDKRIIICGDDDFAGKVNTGRTKATQAADGLGVVAVFPDRPHVDFNDMHVAQGLEAVKACVMAKPKTYQKKAVANDAGNDLYTPSGVLGELVNYYHSTSGNRQNGFAVQAAIACTSVILSRSYQTNLNNRTSLFLLNIGKSGTGKEHCKTVIEQVLDATSNGHLIAGDGYTSGAAVISALQERPKHITVIDEFSKYLQAAQNKYGSSHLQEANTQLMQAIGRLSGVMRAKSYATIGATADRKKELANQIVVNPAITLLGMATPDDMFSTIDVSSVKDGFLNRFIVCVSDAERAIRVHKEPLAVPQRIIEWCETIRSRAGDTVQVAVEPPDLVVVPFSTDAVALQTEFQQFCIDTANSLENFGMAEISGRSNEMAMRLALIVALSRDAQAEVITAEDMRWSIAWVKHNLRTLVEKMKLSVASSEHEGHKKEILKALRERGDDGVTWSAMQKQNPFSKHKAKDLQDILKALLDANLAFSEPFQSGSKGRPTMLWKALD